MCHLLEIYNNRSITCFESIKYGENLLNSNGLMYKTWVSSFHIYLFTYTYDLLIQDYILMWKWMRYKYSIKVWCHNKILEFILKVQTGNWKAYNHRNKLVQNISSTILSLTFWKWHVVLLIDHDCNFAVNNQICKIKTNS